MGWDSGTFPKLVVNQLLDWPFTEGLGMKDSLGDVITGMVKEHHGLPLVGSREN